MLYKKNGGNGQKLGCITNCNISGCVTQCDQVGLSPEVLQHQLTFTDLSEEKEEDEETGRT